MTGLRRRGMICDAASAILLAAIIAAIPVFARANEQTLVAGLTPPRLPAPPAPTQAIDAPPVERLFGDWGGLQSRLQAMGINVQLSALTEFAGNVSGGAHRASSFASQIGFSNDINWERLAGITGLSTHVIIVNRSG